MSRLAISDIHGYNSTFERLLKRIDFQKTDELILLGDYIDRGPDSKGVLDTILDLQDQSYKITCLMGNHEQMLLQTLENPSYKLNWYRNGGDSTMESFSTSSIDQIPEKYIDFISSLKFYYELEDYIFVHAGVNMLADNPLDDQLSLLWLRDWEQKYSKKWLGKRKVIHGHTPTLRNNIIKQAEYNENVVCIDNGCFVERPGYGSLCALDIDCFKFSFEPR